MLQEQTVLNCDSPLFNELAATILTDGKALRFIAQGFSMQPLVRNGDILQVQPVNPQDIRVADAVLFTNDSRLPILHRVIRKKVRQGRWFFWLQGDQARAMDGIVPQDQILGKLTSLQRQSLDICTEEPLYRLLSLLIVFRARLRNHHIFPQHFFSGIIHRMKCLYKYVA